MKLKISLIFVLLFSLSSQIIIAQNLCSSSDQIAERYRKAKVKERVTIRYRTLDKGVIDTADFWISSKKIYDKNGRVLIDTIFDWASYRKADRISSYVYDKQGRIIKKMYKEVGVDIDSILTILYTYKRNMCQEIHYDRNNKLTRKTRRYFDEKNRDTLIVAYNNCGDILESRQISYDFLGTKTTVWVEGLDIYTTHIKEDLFTREFILYKNEILQMWNLLTFNENCDVIKEEEHISSNWFTQEKPLFFSKLVFVFDYQYNKQGLVQSCLDNLNYSRGTADNLNCKEFTEKVYEDTSRTYQEYQYIYWDD